MKKSFSILIKLVVIVGLISAVWQVDFKPATAFPEDPIHLFKGIGMADMEHLEDVDTLQASWYYNWGTCPAGDERCYPMTLMGDLIPGLSRWYDGYILVFNEPANPYPGGHLIDPDLAVQKYATLANYYTRAHFVVGNALYHYYPDRLWMETFYNLCQENPNCQTKIPEHWGWHGYFGCNPGYEQACIDEFNSYVDIIETWGICDYPGIIRPVPCNSGGGFYTDLPGYYWFTEFGEVNHGMEVVDEGMMQRFKSDPKIWAVAYFANRYPPFATWIPEEWNSQAMDFETGVLTPAGLWYQAVPDICYPTQNPPEC